MTVAPGGDGAATAWPLRFQIGARTLARVPRRLIRRSLSLDAAIDGVVPRLAGLTADTDGYLIASIRADRIDRVTAPTLIAAVRHRYRRYWVDLTIGEAAWRGRLSGTARAALRRKHARLAAQPGFAISRHATADEIAAFHPVARRVSALTYQEALFDGGLPSDPAALLSLAAADRARAWLLWCDGRPAAYLACTAEGTALRYDHVGHDPSFAALSPGSVLLAAALADLFAERRFARFDFTEGEGQHKRTLATGAVDCADMLLLRATMANRALLGALTGFDAVVAMAKRVGGAQASRRWAKRVRG